MNDIDKLVKAINRVSDGLFWIALWLFLMLLFH